MSRFIAFAAFLVAFPGAALAQSTSTSNSGSNAGSVAYGIYAPSNARNIKQAPSAIAPGLAASAVETCLGSISAGGSGAGFGLSFGTTVKDEGCEARLDARTLWSFGMKGAALNRLCAREAVRTALLQAGTPCPQDEAQRVVSATAYRQPGVPVSAVTPARDDSVVINGVIQRYR